VEISSLIRPLTGESQILLKGRLLAEADNVVQRLDGRVYYGKGKDDVVLVDGQDKLTVHSVEMPE
jgi:hypothetical protein